MALQRDIVQIVFDKGIDTKTDMHLVSPGGLHRCQNIQRDKIGSVKKRTGSVKIAKDTYPIIGILDSLPDYSSIKRLSSSDNQLLSFGKVTHGSSGRNAVVDSAFLYDPTQSRHIEFTGAASIPVFNQAFQVDLSDFPDCLFDVSSDGTYVLITANFSNATTGVNYYIVQSLSTKKTLFFNRDVSVFDRSAFYAGGLYRVFSKVSGADNLRAQRLNPTDFTIGPEQTLVDDLDTAIGRFDYAKSSANFYIVYFDTGGMVSIKALASIETGTPGTAPTPSFSITLAETALNMFSITVNETANRVYVMFNTAAGTRLWIGDLSLNTVTATATVSAIASTEMTGCAFSDNTTALFYNTASGTVIDVRDPTASVYSAIFTGGSTGEVIASRPVLVDDTLYLNLFRTSELQNAVLLIAVRKERTTSLLYTLQVVGQSLNGQVNTPLNYSHCSLFKASNELLSVYNKVLDDQGSNEYTLVPALITGDLAHEDAYSSGEIANSTFWTGGALQKFDGSRVSTAQPLAYPEITVLTASNGAGALTALGTYSYIAIYEFVDAQGRIIRSAGSLPKSVTLVGAEDTVVPTYKGFNLGCPATTYLYRTTNGGTVYYLETSPSMSDATITANQTLYTSSGELENIHPPPSYAMAIWQDRIFLLTADGIRYSKKAVGARPAQFADELFLDIESEGGLPTAIIGLNDKLLVFKNGRIYYTTGDGPNELGLQGRFEPLKLITPDCGAVSARCVNRGDTITFQSASGYKTIDASFAIKDVLEIDEFFKKSANASVKSIQHFEDKHELRISDGNRTYVKDLVTQQWSTNPEWADIDAIVSGSNYWRLKSNYDILYDNGSSFGDDGTSITTTLTTGWLNPGVIQGLQRVYSLIILARMISETPLKVDIFYDNVPEIFASYTLSPTSKGFAQFSNSNIYLNDSYAPNPDTYPYQWEIRLPKQKCESVRFTISDVPASAQDTFELVALGLLVGLKKKMFTGRDVVKA